MHYYTDCHWDFVPTTTAHSTLPDKHAPHILPLRRSDLIWLTQRKTPPSAPKHYRRPRLELSIILSLPWRIATPLGRRRPIIEQTGESNERRGLPWKRVEKNCSGRSKSVVRTARPAMIYARVLLFVTRWEVIKSKIYSFLFLGTNGGYYSSLCQITQGDVSRRAGGFYGHCDGFCFLMILDARISFLFMSLKFDPPI